MANNNLISKISSATGIAAKSFLGLGTIQSDSISSGSYRGNSAFSNSGWLFDTDNGIDKHFSFNGLGDIINAYQCCAPVFSIINKQSYAFINGRTKIKNLEGKDSETPVATKIKKLLANPNPLQNNKQFEAQMAIYLRLFGYCVIMPVKPNGFPNSDAESMWIIPPYMCTFEFTKESFFNLKKGFLTRVVVKYGDETSILMPDQVIIIKDVTPGFDTIFLPGSPIKPLQQNISNLIGIYNSKGTLINYRGALGILTPEIDPNGAIAVDEEEKETLQNSLMKYGIKNGQWKFIVANSAMKWQQMGIAYKDLMLTEWGEDDTMVICDGLNYPFKLLANTKSSSMAGTEVEAFEKILYNSFILPFSEMVYEQLAAAFESEKNGLVITKDYSHVSVLQEDDVKRNTARLILNNSLKIEYEQGLITKNQWLDALGFEGIGAEGEFRSTDTSTNKVPLATILGVGAIQSLIGVLTAAGMSDEARAATVEILFGVSPDQAALMCQSPEPTTTTVVGTESAPAA